MSFSEKATLFLYSQFLSFTFNTDDIKLVLLSLEIIDYIFKSQSSGSGIFWLYDGVIFSNESVKYIINLYN